MTPVNLPDIQHMNDNRNVAIDKVGVKRLRYPVTILSEQGDVATVGEFSMSVSLPAEKKGTHMSRFLEELERISGAMTQDHFIDLARDVASRLDAASCELEVKFPFFIQKVAPVSNVVSNLDMDVVWRVVIDGENSPAFSVTTVVPATSLCPCSKKISEYGAHNQRSLISITATLRGSVSIETLVSIAQEAASCEVYGILKRPDEKYVTERAYDNPKFVEDIVRDVTVALRQDKRIARFVVEVENFESIHNHSAYAMVAEQAC
ncbi:GTP cyclohydrolase FolE2 [Hyphococcus sp. DH-69]|uniref:GTP cyclohydrolase FolE2 n=1 Tax=Hyphococcus formosus TaxID=3143534 RepID=UPI00398B885F